MLLAALGNTVGSQKNQTAFENPKGTQQQPKEKQQVPGSKSPYKAPCLQNHSITGKRNKELIGYKQP